MTGSVASMGMFTLGMVLTHIAIFVAGIVTTIVMAFVYERYFTKRQHSGVHCESCQRQLSYDATSTPGVGVPIRPVPRGTIRRVRSTRIELAGSRPGEHLRLRR